jgi:hypothetical protein
MNQQTPDRVSFSYGQKVPGEERFSSVDLHLSDSTDIRAGETAEQAMARAKRFVLEQFNARGAPRVEPVEVFDPENEEHRRIADHSFDRHRTPLKSRRYVAERILAGQPLDQVGPLIDADQTLMKKTGGVRPPFRVVRNDGTKSDWDGGFPRRR